MSKVRSPQLQIVPYPEIPLEDVYVSHGLWRGVFSKHTRDLLIILVAVLVATFLIAREIWGDPDLTKPIVWGSQILAAMFTSFLATFAAIYQLSKLRFSTVDVFSSEILARLRIIAADGSVDKIITEADPRHVDLTKSVAARNSSEGVLEPSRESHFETFYRRSSDLGALASVVVDHVTDFYCFQMAARDALRELSATIATFPSESDEIRARVIDVIFMIDLMAYSGYRALNELIETPAHQLHSRQVALSVGTRANSYLMENMPDADHRHPEIIRRNAKYVRLVQELKSSIKPSFFGGGLIPRGKEFF